MADWLPYALAGIALLGVGGALFLFAAGCCRAAGRAGSLEDFERQLAEGDRRLADVFHSEPFHPARLMRGAQQDHGAQ